METFKLTATAGTVSDVVPSVVRRPRTVQAPRQDEPTGLGWFDSLAWTYRNGFDGVLAEVPAKAWREPASQPWQRVKHNAAREVWRATIRGSSYYLKYYVRHTWRDQLKRLAGHCACRAEWNSAIYALDAGVAAVRPAGFTRRLGTGARGAALLVTEVVEPAWPLNQFWRTLQADEEAARRRQDVAQLVERLAEMIARAHQSGFEHRDMHAANLLVQTLSPRRYRTVFVDLHSARLGVPIGDQAVVRNLAQLNQWFAKNSTIGDRLRFLRAYLRWRNEYEHAFDHARALGLSFEALVAALNRFARVHAERLWAQRDRRLRRNGRYFARVRVPGGWYGMVQWRCKQPADESRASTMVLDPAWWRSQLQDPLRWFDRPQSTLVKNSHSVAVTRALLSHPDGELPLIVKRPRARNWRRRVRQIFPPSRSARGWRLGHALLHRDIAAARPLAFLERRVGPLVLDSLLVTEALPQAVDLESYLRQSFATLNGPQWLRCKRELCEAVVRQLRRFHDRGFWHRDCKAQNILVVQQPRLHPVWIDMDGLRRGRRSPRREYAALARLFVSLKAVPGLTRTDRLRFLKSYCAGHGSDPRAWRGAWRAIARAAEQKLARRQARRAWKLAHYGRE